jgi:hypothetical protein
MKPYVHAKLSVKKYGGQPEDYLDIHEWFDQTKMALADVRHRLMLHNSVGCFIAEQVFGRVRTNSDGKVYHVRNVAEDHVIDDLGMIPTLEKCFASIKPEAWMAGGVKKFERESAPQPVEEPSVMKVFTVLEVGFEYNDEGYDRTEGGNVVAAFSTRERAEAEAVQRTAEFLKSVASNGGLADYFRDTDWIYRLRSGGYGFATVDHDDDLDALFDNLRPEKLAEAAKSLADLFFTVQETELTS